MFFSITNHKKENFPCSYELGALVLNTDPGWKTKSTDRAVYVYKGYVDDCPIDDIVEEPFGIPTHGGNFCIFEYDIQSEEIRVRTDKLRGFPVWVDENKEVTNLTDVGEHCWADKILTIYQNLSTHQEWYDVIGEINTDPLTRDEVISQVNDIMFAKAKRFFEHNKLPVKVFLTGGIDTMLVYSYLKDYTDYELVKTEYLVYDYFWVKNSDEVKKFWGYKQIHNWGEDCILVSGTPGDEYTMRGPYSANLFLQNHGINPVDYLKDPANKNLMQYEYFNQPKNIKIFEHQHEKSDNIFWDVLNNLVNDHQHWHLGKTLTWTPLKDINIVKLFMRLPTEDLLYQLLDSTVSKEIIERNAPGYTKYLSKQKNVGNQFENMWELLNG